MLLSFVVFLPRAPFLVCPRHCLLLEGAEQYILIKPVDWHVARASSYLPETTQTLVALASENFETQEDPCFAPVLSPVSRDLGSHMLLQMHGDYAFCPKCPITEGLHGSL